MTASEKNDHIIIWHTFMLVLTHILLQSRRLRLHTTSVSHSIQTQFVFKTYLFGSQKLTRCFLGPLISRRTLNLNPFLKERDVFPRTLWFYRCTLWFYRCTPLTLLTWKMSFVFVTLGTCKVYVALSIKQNKKIIQHYFPASELFLITCIYSEIADLWRLHGESGKQTSTRNTWTHNC